MRKVAPLSVAVMALLAFPAAAQADWTAKGELGASFASGNSENEAAHAVLEVKRSYEKWAHGVGFAGNYGTDGDVTTAQRWELRGQSDYEFTERAYWFGAARYEDDASRPTTTRRRSPPVSATGSSTPSAPSSGCRAAPAIAMPSCGRRVSPRTA